MATARRAVGPLARKGTLEKLVRPVVTAAGYDLEEVSVSRAGKRSLVRVVVDSDDGIDLDAVAAVSRAVSATLDEAADDGLAGVPYTLEVSSPGVDRPLTEPRHWRRNVGRLVTSRVEGRPVVGRIVAAGDDGVDLDVDGLVRTVRFGELAAGRIEVEFRRVAEQSDDGGADQEAGAEEAIDEEDSDEETRDEEEGNG